LLLGVTSAVPIGLIVNEAVTNALKYAFDGTPGEITVTLHCAAERCRLVISDNGRGFASPPREGSLGITLMRRLSRQLEGNLKIDGSDGTTVDLEWNLAPAEQAAKVLSL
jgi:two-component sensor histidine kinase